jgi:hypothetical protein
VDQKIEEDKRKEKDLSRSIILAIEIFEIALTQIYELLV